MESGTWYNGGILQWVYGVSIFKYKISPYKCIMYNCGIKSLGIEFSIRYKGLN